MASTDFTSNYQLPIFQGSDKPSWLIDWNSAMEKIDTALAVPASEIAGLKAGVQANNDGLAAANSTLDGHGQRLDDYGAEIHALQDITDAIQDDVANISPAPNVAPFEIMRLQKDGATSTPSHCGYNIIFGNTRFVQLDCVTTISTNYLLGETSSGRVYQLGIIAGDVFSLRGGKTMGLNGQTLTYYTIPIFNTNYEKMQCVLGAIYSSAQNKTAIIGFQPTGVAFIQDWIYFGATSVAGQRVDFSDSAKLIVGDVNPIVWG